MQLRAFKCWDAHSSKLAGYQFHFFVFRGTLNEACRASSLLFALDVVGMPVKANEYLFDMDVVGMPNKKLLAPILIVIWVWHEGLFRLSYAYYMIILLGAFTFPVLIFFSSLLLYDIKF